MTLYSIGMSTSVSCQGLRSSSRVSAAFERHPTNGRQNCFFRHFTDLDSVEKRKEKEKSEVLHQEKRT